MDAVGVPYVWGMPPLVLFCAIIQVRVFYGSFNTKEAEWTGPFSFQKAVPLRTPKLLHSQFIGLCVYPLGQIVFNPFVKRILTISPMKILGRNANPAVSLFLRILNRLTG